MIMDQKIFSMNLSVEAVSVYLALCGLADAGNLLTVEVLEGVWGSSSDDLKNGILELESHKIILADDSLNVKILPTIGWK